MESEKKEEQSKSKSERPKLQQLPTIWIGAAVVFIILLIVVILLGLQAEKQYGNAVLKILPKNITGKWVGSEVNVVEQKMVEPEKTANSQKPTAVPSITQKVATNGGNLNSNEFILTFSNARKINEDDLKGLTPWELKVARNEIYARHGRPFVSQDLSCYFANQGWYKTDPAYTDKSLSVLETSNAEFILSFEKETNSPVMNKDSGCNH